MRTSRNGSLHALCSFFAPNFKLRMMSEVHSFQMKKSSQRRPIWTPHCPPTHLSKLNLQRTFASSSTTFLTSGWLQSILPRFWILGDRDLFGAENAMLCYASLRLHLLTKDQTLSLGSLENRADLSMSGEPLPGR